MALKWNSELFETFVGSSDTIVTPHTPGGPLQLSLAQNLQRLEGVSTVLPPRHSIQLLSRVEDRTLDASSSLSSLSRRFRCLFINRHEPSVLEDSQLFGLEHHSG